MGKIVSISKVFVTCLIFCCSEAFDICTDNRCKNGAVCVQLSYDEYSCQCNNGYKGQYCEERMNFCHLNPCQNGATCKETEEEYKCHCLNGWYGKTCELNVDDCAQFPCKNGASCQDLPNHKYICKCPYNYIGMHCEFTNPCAEANPCGTNGKCVNDNSGGYKCHCNKGFIGQACSIDVDECVQYNTGLCENGGKCVNTVGSYSCECAKGYSGERCTNDIVDCTNSTCENGGICLDKIGHFKCVCTERFRGNNCENPIPICELKPCKNDGQCQDKGNDYICICPKQWTGRNCETRSDPCFGNQCVNDGICTPDDIDTYRCLCRHGFNGKYCEQNIDDCEGIVCENKGTCQDSTNTWLCNCKPGFSGRYCEINVNDCESRPCLNNGHCVDLVNDYRCDCPLGSSGKNCTTTVNECTSQPCMNGGRCEPRPYGFTCRCLDGYVGLTCESVSDVCSKLLPCRNGGVCHNDENVVEGYVCTCPSGRNEKNCADETSECVEFTCANGGRCLADKNRCICSPGYSGRQCQINIDECRNNPCQHGGSCEDLVNDFKCHCPAGYRGKNCETDVNECSSNPCGSNGECIDGIDGYKCQCFMPYHGPTCASKYDPCVSNTCANDAICVPNYDYKSYHCNCSTAFGKFTGPLCNEDIDECSLNSTELISQRLINRENIRLVNGTCLNGATCINTDGSFICKCEKGYEGRRCETKIDYCDTDPCRNGAKCDVLVDGYRCNCLAGFKGSNCDIEIDECGSHPCQNGATCNDHVNDYNCICMSGFSGKNCDVNDDDCSEYSCSGHGLCVDKVNDIECRCFDGYKGAYCEQLLKPCDKNLCLNNGSCVNLISKTNEPGYICNCKRGYSGPSCEIRMDWCRGSPCGDHGMCVSDGDGFVCTCNEGYIGQRCEVMKVDTCETYAHRRFNNRTLVNQICLNSGFCFNQPELNGFKCSCPSGYGGTFCEENVDDCANQPCLNGGDCKDFVGMYSCKCSLGFQGINCEVNLNDCSHQNCNTGRCVDLINNFTCICPRGTGGRFCEITRNNCRDVKCLNGGQCRTLLGDFDCQCKEGFVGKLCEVDMNECRYKMDGTPLNITERQYGPCSPLGTLTCLDLRADFRCVCKPDYSGRYCQTRLDHCEEIKKMGQLACFNSGTCVNQYRRRNSDKSNYRCSCPTGYGGDRCELYNKQCRDNICQNGGFCRPLKSGTQISVMCDCPPGIGGLFCEKDYVNECDQTICYNGGHCLDGFGKAVCRCSEGFCGDRCEISDVGACNISVLPKYPSYREELSQCRRQVCETKAKNKRCDLECNNLACGFDDGECLHKVPKSVGGQTVTLAAPWSNCSIISAKDVPCHHWFMNGHCDQLCNTEACLFDGWDCVESTDICPKKVFCDFHYGDRQCHFECNSMECDYDGGDCVDWHNSTMSGAIILVLPVPTTVFERLWKSKLLRSLIHLLHSVVRVKTLPGGAQMIYPIRVFADSDPDEILVRHKRSAVAEDSRGKPGSKVYLEVHKRTCRGTTNTCFDNSKAAAEFVSAALHSRLYRPPIPILSVQADSDIIRKRNPMGDMLIYVILVTTCIIVLGVLVGVLHGFLQNKSKSDPVKTKNAETWFPEGMKRLSPTASQSRQRLLANSNRKRNQNAISGITLNSELGNLAQMTKSKISATESIDNSGSNSLTSTQVTSYDANGNENNDGTANGVENCIPLGNCDLNSNFPPEKRLKFPMDANKQSNLEAWCFSAFVHLLISGDGLGQLTSTDSRDKQMIMEKLFHVANNQTSNDNPNMFTDIPNKKELTNSSFTTILTSRVPHSEETLLHLAAKFNRIDATKFLLEAGSDPNLVESNGRTCLHTAIDADALEVVSYLLEQQDCPIDIHQKGPGGVTGLIQAVKGAHLELIQLILLHMQPEECDLNVTDNVGRNALHWASITNQSDVVQLLLTYGLNRDAQDNEEMTALYLSCREGYYEVCKLLLASGANPDMSDHMDRLPRDVARANHFDDIVILLDDYVNRTKESQLQQPLLWGQYSYYSTNRCCPPQSTDFQAAAYPGAHCRSQIPCYSHPDRVQIGRDVSLSSMTHSSYMVNHGSFENSVKGFPNYCRAQNLYPNAYGAYSTRQNATSSTSIPGITPSPDSDSPGQWSTSSSTLSPRSRNQHPGTTHLYHNQPQVYQTKSSVVHYRPTSDIARSVHGVHDIGTHVGNNVCHF